MAGIIINVAWQHRHETKMPDVFRQHTKLLTYFFADFDSISPVDDSQQNAPREQGVNARSGCGADF
jgi:hypothetical protein